MSVENLASRQMAIYLIGAAVMRQLQDAPRDPDTCREISAVGRWVEFWLTGEELQAVTDGTGLLFGDALEEALRCLP